ncbi:hypothetical protein ACA910_005549 [Epithemia clementina (nom. ined.)]
MIGSAQLKSDLRHQLNDEPRWSFSAPAAAGYDEAAPVSTRMGNHVPLSSPHSVVLTLSSSSSSSSSPPSPPPSSSSSSSSSLFVWDAFSVMVTILLAFLIAFAVFVISKDEHPAANHHRKRQQACKYMNNNNKKNQPLPPQQQRGTKQQECPPPQQEEPHEQPPQLVLSTDHVDLIAKRQWKDVLAWIVFSSSTSYCCRLDRKGHSILHHACLFRAPAEIIQVLLWRAPELAAIANPDGEVPLHWAIRLSAPNEHIETLLAACPETGTWAKDKEGLTPLTLLWDRHRESILETWWTDRHRIQSSHAWKRIMLFFPCRRRRRRRSFHPMDDDESVNDDDCTYHHENNNDDDDDDDKNNHNNNEHKDDQHDLEEEEEEEEEKKEETPLHVACRSPCPPGFFSLLLQVYKADLWRRDGHGRLPLHWACSNAVSNRSSDVVSKIQALLRVYGNDHDDKNNNNNNNDGNHDNDRGGAPPDYSPPMGGTNSRRAAAAAACAAVDRDGRNPFHLALEAGIAWDEGLRELLECNPHLILQDHRRRMRGGRDPVTRLDPFLLAATAEHVAATKAVVVPRQEQQQHHHADNHHHDHSSIMKDHETDSTTTDLFARMMDNHHHHHHQIRNSLDTIYRLLRMDPSRIVGTRQ